MWLFSFKIRWKKWGNTNMKLSEHFTLAELTKTLLLRRADEVDDQQDVGYE